MALKLIERRGRTYVIATVNGQVVVVRLRATNRKDGVK